MKQFVLLGTNEPSELEQWLLKIANDILGCNMSSIAIVGFADDNDGVYTAHWNMETFDLEAASAHLHFDAVDGFIKANIDRYAAMAQGYDPDEDEPEENYE